MYRFLSRLLRCLCRRQYHRQCLLRLLLHHSPLWYHHRMGPAKHLLMDLPWRKHLQWHRLLQWQRQAWQLHWHQVLYQMLCSLYHSRHYRHYHSCTPHPLLHPGNLRLSITAARCQARRLVKHRSLHKCLPWSPPRPPCNILHSQVMPHALLCLRTSPGTKAVWKRYLMAGTSALIACRTASSRLAHFTTAAEHCGHQ